MNPDKLMPEDVLYEGVSDDCSIDFVIRWQANELVADIFNNRIDDAQKAYITTESYDNLQNAIKDLSSYALL